jgi:hypothetical protein
MTQPPEKLSEVLTFARELKMNYLVAMGTKETKSLFTSSETLPMTVVIDRAGKVREVIEGIMYPDEFDEKVKPLLMSLLVTPLKHSRRAKPQTINVQSATIVISTRGYQPARLTLRRGVPARLTLIRKVEETCGREIVIPAYGINRPLPLNTPVLVEFTPNKSGRFKFTCGMNMLRGLLVVP